MDIINLFQILLFAFYVYYHNKAMIKREIRIIITIIFNASLRAELLYYLQTNQNIDVRITAREVQHIIDNHLYYRTPLEMHQ